jgi:hypothetical protein
MGLGSLEDIKVFGTVVGQWAVGGLTGWAAGMTNRAHISVNVQGSSTGGGVMGGIVGECTSGRIVESYATGNVTGTGRLGGIAGELSTFGGSSITNSYATGKITATANANSPAGPAGGLVGEITFSMDPQWVYSNPQVSFSYSTGRVRGPANLTGGLVGLLGDGNIPSALVQQYYATNYWDFESSSVTTSAIGKGLKTSQMQTGKPLPGWFSNGPWIYVRGQYPRLQ